MSRIKKFKYGELVNMYDDEQEVIESEKDSLKRIAPEINLSFREKIEKFDKFVHQHGQHGSSTSNKIIKKLKTEASSFEVNTPAPTPRRASNILFSNERNDPEGATDDIQTTQVISTNNALANNKLETDNDEDNGEVQKKSFYGFLDWSTLEWLEDFEKDNDEANGEVQKNNFHGFLDWRTLEWLEGDLLVQLKHALLVRRKNALEIKNNKKRIVKKVLFYGFEIEMLDLPHADDEIYQMPIDETESDISDIDDEDLVKRWHKEAISFENETENDVEIDEEYSTLSNSDNIAQFFHRFFKKFVTK